MLNPVKPLISTTCAARGNKIEKLTLDKAIHARIYMYMNRESNPGSMQSHMGYNGTIVTTSVKSSTWSGFLFLNAKKNSQ